MELLVCPLLSSNWIGHLNEFVARKEVFRKTIKCCQPALEAAQSITQSISRLDIYHLGSQLDVSHNNKTHPRATKSVFGLNAKCVQSQRKITAESFTLGHKNRGQDVSVRV